MYKNKITQYYDTRKNDLYSNNKYSKMKNPIDFKQIERIK